MVEPWSLIAAATAAEPAASPDDGTALPSDPTTLDIDQLMNLRVRGSQRQDTDDALAGRERPDTGDDVPRNDDLPPDLTTLGLGDLMNLRVRAAQQEDEKEDENTDDDDLADPRENGEEPTEAQLIAAEDAAAAAAAAANEAAEAAVADASETEVAQNASETATENAGENGGENGGETGGEGAEGAPPRTSGRDGTTAGRADLGQTVEVLPAELAYVAALQVASAVPSAPPSQPVAAPAPVLQQVAPPPPPPPAPAPAPPANVAPIAGGDQSGVAEDATVIISVLGNDTDADGDSVQVVAVTQGQNGQVAINANGTLAYTPAADFFGTDAFTYTISDGRGGTSTATVSLVVRPVNDAPVAADDAARTEQGQPVTFAVLANDTDVDGDVLSVRAVSQGANGKVAINADGTLTYFPAAQFAGTDTFTYTVSDGLGGSAQATVSVIVNPANAPPTTNAAVASGNEDATSIAVTLTGGDRDGTLVSFALSSLPVGGTLYTDVGLTTLAATGTNYAATGETLTLYFVPDADYNGVTTFDFAGKDDSGDVDSTPATATITVNAVNDAPVAAADAVSTNEDVPLVIAAAALLANDSDVDLDNLSIAGFTQGANGVVVDNGNGTFTYTPNANYIGADSFTYTLSDGNGGTDVATVNVNVIGGVTLNGGAGDDTLVGGVGNDTINGNAGNDTLLGGAGNDLLTGGAGVDVLDGGTGNDTASYVGSGGSIKIDLAAGIGGGGDADGDTLIGIENLVGSVDSDTLIGDAAANILDGGPGSDTLDGGAGNDTLIGGTGSDTLDGGAGSDTVDYSGSGAGVTVDLAAGKGDDGEGGSDDLIAIENLTGSSFADTLTGDGGANVLDGSLGVDQLFGGRGDDILLWDPDDAVLDGGIGRDTLEISGGNVDLVNFANKIGGIEIIDLVSDDGANHLTLNVQDILDISDNNIMTVLGDGLDSVDAGRGWTSAGSTGQGNDIYIQSIGGAVAALIVDSDIQLNGDILF